MQLYDVPYFLFGCYFHVDAIKTFLTEYCKRNEDDGDGPKVFVYLEQLVRIAHREQVLIVIELDHLNEFNAGLAEAVMENNRRYASLFSDVIFEILPNYKERNVPSKDALDVFIKHRLQLEALARDPMDERQMPSKFPTELMKRL